MKTKLVFTMIVGLTISISLGLAYPSTKVQDPDAKQKSPEKETEDDFAPVDNMHHFMEYICEPSYKSLQAAMANKPANRRAWSPIKSAALILAETSSIVASRGPKDDAKKMAEWKKISVDVYQSAKGLYSAAGKNDYDLATKQYGLMIENCNKCHTVFDEGKHQLKK